jgi:hypothetical protein
VSSYSLDPLVQSIGWALINFIWQGPAIDGAIALVLRVIGGQRAAIRDDRSYERGFASSSPPLLVNGNRRYATSRRYTQR